MRYFSFVLSMPSNNAWDGKWSGAGKLYAIVKSLTNKSKLIPTQKHYHYSFGDGWVAAVTVSEVTLAEAKKIRKQSIGFYGYDWMVDSIICYGMIAGREEKECS